MDQSLPPTDAAVINKSNDYFALVQKSLQPACTVCKKNFKLLNTEI